MSKLTEPRSSEITDERHYLNRRTFLQGAALAATTTATALLYRALSPGRRPANAPAEPGSSTPGDLSAELTPFEDVTGYNNFYEFSTDKSSVAERSRGFVTEPWTVTVGGLVHKPGTFDLDDLLRLAPEEERVYRLRCVEAWSMVIPWLGFPLAALLNKVEPLGSASYVRFMTLYDPERMPGQRSRVLDWPYVEGLRLDEARHPLTLLSTGLYGRRLLPQNGAPLRLVVPWKYGFKSIKSIVHIALTSERPVNTWHMAVPREYGFYANVNPHVDHPRWSQATERRIGEWGRRDTLLFNGYADEVGHMYSNMDLTVEF
jgi:sulfoxide reductase catalytic subunit YedY